MLKITIKTRKRNDAPYMGVDFVATNSSRYYIYAANLSQILIPSYYLKIYI